MKEISPPARTGLKIILSQCCTNCAGHAAFGIGAASASFWSDVKVSNEAMAAAAIIAAKSIVFVIEIKIWRAYLMMIKC